MGMVLLMMPPATPFMGLFGVLLLTTLMPSTTTWESSTRDTTCPRLPLSPARNDDDFVTFNNLVHVETSKNFRGQDTIFMNFRRAARVTGPKMRVPMGSSLALSNTAALPSNLIRAPSGTADAFGGANHHGTVNLAF